MQKKTQKVAVHLERCQHTAYTNLNNHTYNTDSASAIPIKLHLHSTRATFLLKMDLAKLHLLNGGFDHDNWDLTDGNNCLK